MSKSTLSNLIDPKRVAEAAKDRKSREHAMLCGALGAIEKGGKAVGGDESSMQKAAHYGRVLSGIEKHELGEKHYGEIADMVKSFVQGPQEVPKHRRSSMKPSDLSNELRRIASAIDNSKNPSKELVLKEIKRIASRISADEYAEYEITIKVPASWYHTGQKALVELGVNENDLHQIVTDALMKVMGAPPKSKKG